MAALIVIGALLLAVIVLLAFLLLRPAPTPVSNSASPTPTPSASPTRTATPTPTPTPTSSGNSGGSSSNGGSTGNGGSGGGSQAAPLVVAVNVSPGSVACNGGGPGQTAVTNFDIAISWTSQNATAAYVGIDTADASTSPYEGPLAPSGSLSGLPFSCYGDHTYTVTVVDAAGNKKSQSTVIHNVGDPGPAK
jgi:hypothetical protein